MHVIANSDSEEDQQLKLKVRDAVLSAGKEVFDGSVTAIEAKEKITPYIDYLENIALETIKNEGFDYNVKITVEREYFNTRTYENSVTLPAGYYTAVKVIIGEGKGQNWWCVLYPNMCFKGSVFEVIEEEASESLKEVLNPWEYADVFDSGKVEFRFKFLEYFTEKG